jgi:alkanesulfonate monooxygenase SsuD/methylene tetrahydromethanopterin reductase-like flavin-dependent oxidoreductase (luciferase family)
LTTIEVVTSVGLTQRVGRILEAAGSGEVRWRDSDVKFALLNEGSARVGIDRPTIYREVIETIDAAEAAGFDVFGCSEQHFWPDFDGLPAVATIPTPEIFYAIASQRTQRIGIRTAIATLPLRHPLLTAEQIATLDIVLNGRMQLGTGRGNSYLAADAFGIPMAETYERWEESLRIIIAAWASESDFGWDGKYFTIPPRPFPLKPLQKPHPPVLYAALSPQSHELAGRLGLGLLTGTAGITLEKVAKRIDLYRSTIKDAKPITAEPYEYVSLTVLGHCHEDSATARKEAEQAFINYYTAATLVYSQTVHRLDSTVNFTDIQGKYNFEAMTDTAMIICGDPDTWTAKLGELRDLGIDELTINFAGVEHDAVIKAIDLLGREVLPRFQS